MKKNSKKLKKEILFNDIKMIQKTDDLEFITQTIKNISKYIKQEFSSYRDFVINLADLFFLEKLYQEFQSKISAIDIFESIKNKIVKRKYNFLIEKISDDSIKNIIINSSQKNILDYYYVEVNSTNVDKNDIEKYIKKIQKIENKYLQNEEFSKEYKNFIKYNYLDKKIINQSSHADYKTLVSFLSFIVFENDDDIIDKIFYEYHFLYNIHNFSDMDDIENFFSKYVLTLPDCLQVFYFSTFLSNTNLLALVEFQAQKIKNALESDEKNIYKKNIEIKQIKIKSSKFLYELLNFLIKINNETQKIRFKKCNELLLKAIENINIKFNYELNSILQEKIN